MPDTDAPQVEPLKLPLEEALARIGERGYTLAVYHHEDASREYVLHDVYSAFARGSFGHWKDAVEAVLGRPVVLRDDTAELVELLARMTYTARILHQNAPPAGDDAEVLALITAAEAALARVRSGER